MARRARTALAALLAGGVALLLFGPAAPEARGLGVHACAWVSLRVEPSTSTTVKVDTGGTCPVLPQADPSPDCPPPGFGPHFGTSGDTFGVHDAEYVCLEVTGLP